MKVIYAWIAIVVFFTIIGMGAVVVEIAHKTHDAHAGLTITAPDGYAVSCATQHLRLFPHYCLAQIFNSSGLTLDVTCHSIDVHALSGNLVPTTARVGEFALEVLIVANNSVVQRAVDLTFYSDPSCNIAFQATPTLTFRAREEVAAVGNPTIVRFPSFNNTFPMSSGAILNYVGTVTNCGVCSAQVFEVGYYD